MPKKPSTHVLIKFEFFSTFRDESWLFSTERSSNLLSDSNPFNSESWLSFRNNSKQQSIQTKRSPTRIQTSAKYLWYFLTNSNSTLQPNCSRWLPMFQYSVVVSNNQEIQVYCLVTVLIKFFTTWKKKNYKTKYI